MNNAVAVYFPSFMIIHLISYSLCHTDLNIFILFRVNFNFKVKIVYVFVQFCSN